MSCEGRFLQELRERGFRLTPQRELVLSVLHDVEGLATADEIFGQVHAQSSAVDISTVYRTLDLLDEMGMVATVDAGDGQRRFGLLGVHGPHLHLVCNRCGSVSGVDLCAAEALASELHDSFGFAADLGHLTIPGLCVDCSGAGARGGAEVDPG